MDAMLAKAEKYVGMPYLEGEFDCADLAVMVQWELFDRLVALPARRKRPRGAMGQAREIHALQADLADRIDTPVTGCGVLMYEPLDNGQRWHIGTAFVAGGEVWLLHNNFTMGCACLQRLADLQRFGARLDGYYAWRSA
ncbi:MAG: hypothetical protein Q7K57_61355 [Burkholderiaceae bacterium]|nr:hypothetical protein [Burkholderiaceae bacterium]